MFAVKREQREKVGEPVHVDRTVRWVRHTFPEHVLHLDDEELRFRVRHAVDKARSYGLRWESSLGIFVAHALTINPAFDEHRAVRAVLVDPSIAVEERMQALLGLVEEHEWEEAARQSEPDEYWQRVHEASRPGGAAPGKGGPS